MKKDILKPDAPDLTSEACAWLAQLETGALSTEDLAAFREWIKRSPRHHTEITRLARLSHEINVLADMAGPLRDAAGRRAPVLRRRAAGRSLGGRRAWPAAIAATLAVAIAAALLLITPSPRESAEPYLIATAIGETQDVALTDGSHVKVNTASQIEVDFDRGRRRVRLLKGEAFFEVAHDPDRPFAVYAGDKLVTAVGTAFAVRWTDNDLVVTVSEGRVVFSAAAESGASKSAAFRQATGPEPAQARPAPTTLLQAGQRLAMSDAASGEAVENISQRELSRELAWRSGLLDFENAPLGEVVQEMQRYTRLKIDITEDGLGDLKFGGVFRAGETEAFFDALELSFGVEVVRLSDDRVLLQSAG
jgi:transmembrane sensor